MTDLAYRLRDLQEHTNWSVADMAERTGIPKRSFEKYLLRDGASLPGFEALCQMSKGLGVSLDWLVFGADGASEPVVLLAERATYDVARLYIETLLRYHSQGRPLVENGEVLGLETVTAAFDLADRAGDVVKKLIKEGTTKEDLLGWRAAIRDRLLEAAMARSERILDRRDQPAEPQKKR